MPRSFSDRDFRVHHWDYLTNVNEPQEALYDGRSSELDAGLIKSSYFQKRGFRRIAKRLRKYGR